MFFTLEELKKFDKKTLLNICITNQMFLYYFIKRILKEDKNGKNK